MLYHRNPSFKYRKKLRKTNHSLFDELYFLVNEIIVYNNLNNIIKENQHSELESYLLNRNNMIKWIEQHG